MTKLIEHEGTDQKNVQGQHLEGKIPISPLLLFRLHGLPHVSIPLEESNCKVDERVKDLIEKVYRFITIEGLFFL